MYSKILKYGFPVLVLLVFLYSFFTIIKPLPEAVSDAQWKEAEKIVHANMKSDSVIIVHPAWEDSVLKYFKDDFIILGKPNNGIQDTAQQIWVILSHGSARPNYLENFKVNFEKKLSELEILRYVDLDAEHILYDFYYNIPDARVKLYSGDKTKDCNWKDEKWVCPVRVWNYLGKRSVQIGKKWHHAIWFHPIRDWTTSATYKNVPMGKRLVGEYALSDQAAELKNGAPVDFVIKINGKEKARMKSERTYGWHTFELDTKDLSGKKADVSFEVSADNDGLRHFSFMARTRDDEVGSPLSKTFDAPFPVVDKDEIKDSKKEREKEKGKDKPDSKKKDDKQDIKKDKDKDKDNKESKLSNDKKKDVPNVKFDTFKAVKMEKKK